MKNNFQNSGFTLIESLVAITVLMFSIVGPLYSADRAIVATQNARSQLTASYLAQEGIEQVRAVRDNEYLAVYDQTNASQLAWDNFLLDGSAIASCRSGDFCQYDPVDGTLTPCSDSCDPLYLRNDGFYTLRTDAGTPTIFTRTIQVLDVLGADGTSVPNDKRVVSKVLWDFHGTIYSVTVSDHLTPWQ